MITFSCKKISKKDLIKCTFDLNKTEYNLLLFLFGKNKKYTVFQISKNMELDRTTIQKAIKILVIKNLIRRTQRNISKGGYTFLYEINNKNQIKKRIKKMVYTWYKGIERAIEEL